MGAAHLAQAGGRRVGPPRQWAGTLAWGACGAGLHYPRPERGEPGARIPGWPRGSFCLRLDFEYPENPGPVARKRPALPRLEVPLPKTPHQPPGDIPDA